MDANLAAFLKVLDPEDTTTGGGTASAIAGAMAGAIVAMVARLPSGTDGTEPDLFYVEIAQEAAGLSGQLLDGGHEDSQAFVDVRRAFRLLKQTGEQKAARGAAIQAAWLNATHVPLSNAERCARVLELGAQLRGRSNLSAASDLESALHLARAGVLGCLETIAANLPSIKDQSVVAELTARASTLRASARALARAHDSSL